MSFALTHARREIRSTWKRLGLYMGSITLGVAALVAINSFRTNIIASVHQESRNLLGADLEFHSSRAFPDSVAALFDSLQNAGVPMSFLTSMPSMAIDDQAEFSRLVQVKALTGDFPYYGPWETTPEGARSRLNDGRNALVDPTVLAQLDVAIGDTIGIGESRFAIAGTILTTAGDVAFQTAVGPRVFIPGEFLDETGLIQYGSLVNYQAYAHIPENQDLQDFLNQYNQFFRDQQVGYDTVAERIDDLTFAVENMTRFLGLVGLTALLLGGVGVASAVHVFTKEKLDTVATLRCLGARQRSVFSAYLTQAALLGLAGASAGVTLGIIVQKLLPRILRDTLPLNVEVAIDWWMVGTGLLIGVWVASVFALLPLLAILDVSPLRALRREFESVETRSRLYTNLAYLALAGSIITISLWQAPFAEAGWAFAGAVAVGSAVLWGTALLLISLTRRYFPRRARYVIRQGIANLFRPQNQTVAVTIALGFGVFLISTIYIVQRNILDRFRIDGEGARPNMVAIDIQSESRAGVEQIFSDAGYQVETTPIIPARLTHLNNRTIDEIMSDTTGPRVARWALRREYRHTYRDSLTSSEALLSGTMFEEAPPSDVARISIEQEIADDLNVGIGDRITWNIQGVSLESEIVNVRSVNWARFEPNFFVIFEPEALRDAPQTFVAMSRVDDPDARITIQRDIVRGYSNVSVMDLAILQDALDDILGKVTLAIRFMALFCIASGLVVLVGAIATSRYHRLRESVLLKTLGANAKQIGQIFSTEYAALGSLAGLTGAVLALAAGWLLIRFLFEIEFNVPGVQLALLVAGVAALTTAIGLASSRTIARKPPLAVIREANE